MADAAIDVTVDTVFRREAGRVLGTLIRLLGDFELAEESLQEAFEAALEQWPRNGEPENPRAWLVRAGTTRASIGCGVSACSNGPCSRKCNYPVSPNPNTRSVMICCD